MKQIMWLSAGMGLGIIIQACASVTFPYTSYGLNMKSQELLAASGSNKPDEPLSICDATANNASPCIVFMQADYLALKTDYEDKEIQLQTCQNQLKNLQ